jgi:hypothetical protein
MANKYKPHVRLIPEDDANRQIAIGFINHWAVSATVVDIRGPAGGWPRVLDIFESEYLPDLRKFPNAHVVMLIDFDEDVERREQFEQKIPRDVKERVFVIVSKYNPEILRRELKLAFDIIGSELAQECHKEEFKLWQHEHLIHNSSELQRMMAVVKPIVFQ